MSYQVLQQVHSPQVEQPGRDSVTGPGRMPVRRVGTPLLLLRRNSLNAVSIQTLGDRLTQTCPIQVSRLDNLVLIVKCVPGAINFYYSVLGVKVVPFKGTRKALAFEQKFNLHQLGQEFEHKAKHPTAASADVRLITSTPATVAAHRKVCGVQIAGPSGKITSLYVRDPDHNLTEVSSYNQSTSLNSEANINPKYIHLVLTD
ncbi:LOW QUALITY PROTEIN: glyoxalase domain-containing protein 5 [Spinachia spinachia]